MEENKFIYSWVKPRLGEYENIRFATIEQIMVQLRHKDTGWLGRVELPNDARVKVVDSCEWEADKLIVTDVVRIEDFEGWNDNEFCKRLIDINPYCLYYVKNQTIELFKQVLNIISEEAILYMSEQDFDPVEYEEICTLAVQHDGDAIQYIKNQTYELCKLAVQQNPFALQYVKSKNLSLDEYDELCKLAVQQNGLALCVIKNQTPELCQLAVQQDGIALQYVKNQTEEICRLAIQQNDIALMFVKNQTYDLCKLALQQDGKNIELVDDPTPELCELAVQENSNALDFLENPSID